MQEGFINYAGAGNFDPNSLANMTSTCIMFVVINDNSSSVRSYASDMNKIERDLFLNELRNSHRKDEILVKVINFSDTVKHRSGFQPILSVPDDYFDVNPNGMTALYDAVLEGLEQSIEYRKQLELQGIECRTALFISTDGDDNSSDNDAPKKISKLIGDLRKNEAWASSFTINMLGVGDSADFENACKEMGLDHTKCLVTINNSSAEIRKQLGVVSQSITSGNAATVNF